MSCRYGEARIKQSIGKLELPETFRADIAEQGFRELAVLGEHTDELMRLPIYHRDPFDLLRMTSRSCPARRR